ncbi:MAG: M17 family peptidase N-terminal domain-containing protein, partial [Caldimonas sp.]
MDFGHRVATAQSLAKLEVDSLVVVVAGETIDPALGAPLGHLLAEAVAEGDLALKKGRTLYLHRPAGMAARRVVVSIAGDASPKAFKAAAAHAFATLKASGAKSLAIGWAGGDALGEGHAEAAVLALADATYLYRHSKPSAPAAWAPKSLTVLCRKEDAKAVQAGLARAAAIAEGVTLARE